MKRCPQCQFIYPNSDEVCDFDQTPLVAALESEIAAITNTPEHPGLADLTATHTKKSQNKKHRTLQVAAALALLLVITICGVYFAVRRQMYSQSSGEQTKSSFVQPPVFPSPSPSPLTTPSPSPEQTASEATPPSPNYSKPTTAHSNISRGPISTTAPGTSSKPDTKPVILLTTGGKVEADVVWRTKDGIWYRRNGIVTLLKKDRVKAVVNQ